MAYNFLVVDDSKIVRSVVVKTLRLCIDDIGEIYEATNGEEGLYKLENHWIDMVFADINMPQMNGIEMIQKMKQDGVMAIVPVVVISTEGSDERIIQLKKLGVKEFLRKPFLPEDLREVVYRNLGDG